MSGGIAGRHNTLQRANGQGIRLGGSVTGKTILQVSGGNDSEPEEVVVSLYRRNLVDPQTVLANCLTRARVRWGTGKVAQSMVCDFHHGAKFSLNASMVEVSAECIQAHTSSAFVVPLMECSASYVLGSSSSRQLSLTEPRSVLGIGASQDFSVPDFAVKAVWNGTGNVTATMSGDKATFLSALALTPGQEFTIGNGVEYVTITNTAGVGIFGQLVWLLSI